MKKKERIFGKFLWEYRRTGAVFAVCACIFGLIFGLYDLETEAVLYASGLCVLFLGVILTVSFLSRKKTHAVCREILRNPELLTEELPEPGMLVEADCREIIFALREAYEKERNAWQNERRESMEYYTTWVHQIKTPISVMRMMLKEDTESCRELSVELFRIEQYVEMALNWMRLGSESSDFVFREYELDGIIRQAVRKYAPQFIRNKIRLSYEPADCTALTDEKWLLFIIEQLLSNAVKYTPEGTVSICVMPGPVLKIADTGIGIAPEDVPRIFEKGFTGYNGRTDRKSTGLGLYLCRRTAEKLSHGLRVESEPGKGTAFYLDLHRERIAAE